MVMIDVWSDGCAPCKRLAKDVFMDAEVAPFINARYVSLKVNVKDTLGKTIYEKYDVQGFPTVLFLDSEGSEIDRIFGYNDDPEAYFKTVKAYAAGKNTLRSMLTRLEGEPDDIDLNRAIAQKYVARGEGMKSPRFYSRVLQLDPADEKGYAEEAHYALAVVDMWTNDEVKPLAVLLNRTENEEFKRDGYQYMLKYYKKKEDPEGVVSTYKKLLAAAPRDADRMNQCAWYIYEQEMSAQYGWGTELAQEAVSIKPEAAYIWDTLAWLHYVKGNKEKAVEAMKQAVALAPEKDKYRKNLQKMKAGV
jgi:tetratricopeptide (TPR) repeat protein